MQQLPLEIIEKEVDNMAGWTILDGKLHKEFIFDDFKTAFKFMSDAAKKCDEMNHHPEWTNIYNKVTVNLITHDAGGITQNDIDLGKFLNTLQ